jgi:hypothetical protein
MFAEQSLSFTPFFDSSPTRHAILNIDNVEEGDIPDLITYIFSLVGVIRDDVDTKPARA